MKGIEFLFDSLDKERARILVSVLNDELSSSYTLLKQIVDWHNLEDLKDEDLVPEEAVQQIEALIDNYKVFLKLTSKVIVCKPNKSRLDLNLASKISSTEGNLVDNIVDSCDITRAGDNCPSVFKVNNCPDIIEGVLIPSKNPFEDTFAKSFEFAAKNCLSSMDECDDGIKRCIVNTDTSLECGVEDVLEEQSLDGNNFENLKNDEENLILLPVRQLRRWFKVAKRNISELGSAEDLEIFDRFFDLLVSNTFGKRDVNEGLRRDYNAIFGLRENAVLVSSLVNDLDYIRKMAEVLDTVVDKENDAVVLEESSNANDVLDDERVSFNINDLMNETPIRTTSNVDFDDERVSFNMNDLMDGVYDIPADDIEPLENTVNGEEEDDTDEIFVLDQFGVELDTRFYSANEKVAKRYLNKALHPDKYAKLPEVLEYVTPLNQSINGVFSALRALSDLDQESSENCFSVLKTAVGTTQNEEGRVMVVKLSEVLDEVLVTLNEKIRELKSNPVNMEAKIIRLTEDQEETIIGQFNAQNNVSVTGYKSKLKIEGPFPGVLSTYGEFDIKFGHEVRDLHIHNTMNGFQGRIDADRFTNVKFEIHQSGPVTIATCDYGLMHSVAVRSLGNTDSSIKVEADNMSQVYIAPGVGKLGLYFDNAEELILDFGTKTDTAPDFDVEGSAVAMMQTRYKEYDQNESKIVSSGRISLFKLVKSKFALPHGAVISIRDEIDEDTVISAFSGWIIVVYKDESYEVGEGKEIKAFSLLSKSEYDSMHPKTEVTSHKPSKVEGLFSKLGKTFTK